MQSDETLTKKEKKRYSSLIHKKLKDMGVTDQILYVGSGVFKPHFKIDAKGKIMMKDGKPETVQHEMQQASNPVRSLVKNLLAGPRSTIEAFLATELPAPAPAETPKQSDEILIESGRTEKANGEAQGN